ncbi:MAG: alpha-galactosidase [Dysgonamonadaceae bacterium]|jgi:alpha-galactosidase|nr:alpha-galactosidase [Dysgonamonadaceae bacterium]
MRQLNISILFLCIAFVAWSKNGIESGKWKLSYSSEQNGIAIEKNSSVLCSGLYASWNWEGKEISTRDYSNRKWETNAWQDAFGKGFTWTVTYSGKDLPVLVQTFYVYPEKDYLLTEFFVKHPSGEIASNYMAPVHFHPVEFPFGEEGRALFVPYDNDAWIRFQSHPLTFDRLTSYEVTAVFNPASRKGIVLGSIEHDYWKTAVTMTSAQPEGIGSLVCYGGVADSLTRDSKPHGALSGKVIKSPKVLLGVFDDWRNGLEQYGEANALVAPPKAWDKAVPFGWNSWGVLQFNLTYSKAMQVSDFFRNYLQEQSFLNSDHTLYVGLDSGWDRFTEDELKSFVQQCRKNGQIAGIYWTPFTDWGRNPEATVREATEYQFKDIYIYSHGKPQELDGAYAIDPTHPAIEERMKKASELFHRCGFEYVKMDFMTHGALESDRWYRPEIRTGVQAYNYGMELLNRYFGDMYINLSISPVFPAQYAQSRRIACDAWNKIKDTEYTMNAVSYGWWIDQVYQYNDADHVVLREASEGENRARVTSAVITGLYIVGDDFSEEGSEEGKERAKMYLTNPRINAIANGVSFRPLEGNGEKSENQFVRTDEDGTYYVCFNYTEAPVDIRIPWERIGIAVPEKMEAVDCWKHEKIDIRGSVSVPGKDVLVVKITG